MHCCWKVILNDEANCKLFNFLSNWISMVFTWFQFLLDFYIFTMVKLCKLVVDSQQKKLALNIVVHNLSSWDRICQFNLYLIGSMSPLRINYCFISANLHFLQFMNEAIHSSLLRSRDDVRLGKSSSWITEISKSLCPKRLLEDEVFCFFYN